MKYFTNLIRATSIGVCLTGMLQAQVPIWDTLSTQCTRLVVDDRGEVGLSASGGVNLDFTTLGGDCDPSASVYLKSGGPFAIRKVGTAYPFNSSLWQTQLSTTRGWEVMPSGQTPGPISGPGYTGFKTGTMWNSDHSIAVQKTYYAPSVTDSCNFIIQKSVFFGVGGPKTNVTIGEMVDWDVPSDQIGMNTSGFFANWPVFQKGIGTGGCQPNQDRMASMVFLGMYTPEAIVGLPCYNNPNSYGWFVTPTDTLLKADLLSNSDEGLYFWNRTGAMIGLNALSGSGDYASVLTYTYDYTLDTLVVFTALLTGKNGPFGDWYYGIRKSREFYRTHLRPGCPDFFSCCRANSGDGRRGNIDCDPGKGIDISDFSALIDHLYISFTPLCCEEAADCDGDGRVDISDVTCMIDYLYICFGCFPAYCN